MKSRYKLFTVAVLSIALSSCVTTPIINTGLSGSIAFDVKPVVEFTVLDSNGNTLCSSERLFGLIAPNRQQKLLLAALDTNCRKVTNITVTRAYDIDAPTISISGVPGTYSE
jgi:hypothetical protein